MTVENPAAPTEVTEAPAHGVELTEPPRARPRPCSTRRAAPTCRCASPSSRAAARACVPALLRRPQPDGDHQRDFNGLTVAVDRMSAPYLQGAVIDFVDTIEKQGFTIDNPNAGGSCACGDSFN